MPARMREAAGPDGRTELQPARPRRSNTAHAMPRVRGNYKGVAFLLGLGLANSQLCCLFHTYGDSNARFQRAAKPGTVVSGGAFWSRWRPGDEEAGEA